MVHRIGVLLHDYLHGIPFRRRRNNLAMVSLFDGLMLMFGTLEVFRGTHLAHHRWLNTPRDPAMETENHFAGRTLVERPGSASLVGVPSLSTRRAVGPQAVRASPPDAARSDAIASHDHQL
jgi:fatty acid desaturase